MKVYRPSELRTFLEEAGLFAKKRLSQNFLIDGNIIQKILKTAQVQPGDRILEIGPGPGALTAALLEAGAHVTAIELDPLFATKLERLQTPDSRLEIISQDALLFPFETRPGKVVANLPYHISTPLLTRLLPLTDAFTSLTVMVQKEFAERMKEDSSLCLFVQFYATITSSFTVSPSCFYPRPTVSSAVVHCKLHSPPLKEADSFFILTRTAFQQRRKMLRTSLKSLYPHIESALKALDLPPTTRPEELSLETFIALFHYLADCHLS
jgi:16S rRNA (adenine1518-N6/adenine1519-N6)-dimethyltransferase